MADTWSKFPAGVDGAGGVQDLWVRLLHFLRAIASELYARRLRRGELHIGGSEHTARTVDARKAKG